jgi:hypothetical protein
VTIYNCLRFETSLFVASYDSQGHGGGIRPLLHTSDTPTNELRLVYNFQAARIYVTISNGSSVILCYPLPRGSVSLLIFVATETYVNPWQRFDLHQRIRCSGNLCLSNRCLVNGLSLPAFRRCLLTRCLAMFISVTIFLSQM